MSWIEYVRSVDWNQAGAICIAAYVLGCFTAGYYLVRFSSRQDIRDLGSGSVGARNVGRILGKPGFFLTCFCDFGKGILAVWLARHFTANEHIVGMAMLAVVAGHIWPMQLRFHGGKGMATSLGALLMFEPREAFVFAGLFLCLAAIMRRITLPSLFALAALPLAALMLDDDNYAILALTGLAILVLAGHRKNFMEEISRLLERRHLDSKPNQSQL